MNINGYYFLTPDFKKEKKLLLCGKNIRYFFFSKSQRNVILKTFFLMEKLEELHFFRLNEQNERKFPLLDFYFIFTQLFHGKTSKWYYYTYSVDPTLFTLDKNFFLFSLINLLEIWINMREKVVFQDLNLLSKCFLKKVGRKRFFLKYFDSLLTYLGRRIVMIS